MVPLAPNFLNLSSYFSLIGNRNFKKYNLPTENKQAVNYLALTPQKIKEYLSESGGLVTVLIPRFENKFWNKWLPKRLTQNAIKINLDEMGSAVWLQIDGHKKVEEICEKLDMQFGEKVRPTEDRVVKFMSQLFANKMITFKEIE